MSTSSLREPLISIVMPVYNGGRFLVDAIASIIEQSLHDWELICVNDGSTDDSLSLLDWFADEDSRLRIINQPNLGIVAALNGGCAIARAPLICRMDCDDVALPDRLEKQATFMRKNPTCTVVGGAILEIDKDSDPLGVSRLPQHHDEIVDRLLHRRTGHFHPTTMIRAEALEAVGGYRKKFQWIEDHDLWLRLARRGTLANLPDPLLCYRQHAGSVCWQRSAEQRVLMSELLREAHAVRGMVPPRDDLSIAGSERTPAGPGKWARLAAKRGYARSAWKHLSALRRSQASNSYKARMHAEVLLRLAWQQSHAWFRRRPTLNVPQFPQWHRLASESLNRDGALPTSEPKAA
jgi:glycosyltransferase involved in cell wall biosynthesis